MSVLRKNSNNLETIAPNFYRTWVGTNAAYELEKATIPNGTLIYITDDTAPVSLLETAYPVGSVYISFNSTNPATLFGFGTWVQLDGDLYLKTVNTNESSGTTSGSNTKTITVANLPTHSHTFTPSGTITSTFSGNAASHTHALYTDLSSSSYSTVYARGSSSSVGGIPFSDSTGSRGYNTTNGGSTQIMQNTTTTPTGSVTSTFAGVSDTTSTVGSGTAIDAKPSSIAVYMFRRTA